MNLEQLTATSAIVEAHFNIVERSLVDARTRGDEAASESLRHALSRCKQVRNTLRGEISHAEAKAMTSSPEFQRRATFRQKLFIARGGQD
jgi:hypothetical protein